MEDQDFYITSYVYDLNLAYKIYSDLVFRTSDVVAELGLGGSVNPLLLEADPQGEVELSASLVITTSTSSGDLSRNAGLDVTRTFAPGAYTFGADGEISGKVSGVVFVRSDGSFEGKYFSAPIDLDDYSRRRFSDLVASPGGTPVTTLDPFLPYLPEGWQQDPFGSNLVSVLGEGVAAADDGSSDRSEPLRISPEPDRFLLQPSSFVRDAADRITGFDVLADRVALDSRFFPGLAGFGLDVIASVDAPAGSSRAERKAYKKQLKAQRRALKRLGRSGGPFIYSQPTGELIYDQNGTRKGFGAGGVFAIFEDRPLLGPGLVELV